MKLKLACLVLITFALVARAEDPVVTEKPFNLKFTAVDGRKVDLAQMRGKIVLVDFWATWCPGCREEVPRVVAAYQKYHEQGFEVVGISLDKDKDKLTTYTKDKNMPWPQYFDGQGWDNAISSKLGVQEIPGMLIIGRDGSIIPPNNGGDLDLAISKALAAKS